MNGPLVVNNLLHVFDLYKKNRSNYRTSKKFQRLRILMIHSKLHRKIPGREPEIHTFDLF